MSPEHKMCILNLSTSFIRNIYHYEKNLAKYDQKRTLVSMYGNRHSFRILNLLKTKRRPLYLKTQFVQRSKHFSSRL